MTYVIDTRPVSPVPWRPLVVAGPLIIGVSIWTFLDTKAVPVAVTPAIHTFKASTKLQHCGHILPTFTGDIVLDSGLILWPAVRAGIVGYTRDTSARYDLTPYIGDDTVCTILPTTLYKCWAIHNGILVDLDTTTRRKL
jgi:hypothetical protein